MGRISWTEHKTNEDYSSTLLLFNNKVEEKRSLMDIIRTRQQNWIGHILRGKSLQREIMKGRLDGKRGRGRPRQKLMNWLKENGYGKLKEKAQHRKE